MPDFCLDGVSLLTWLPLLEFAVFHYLVVHNHIFLVLVKMEAGNILKNTYRNYWNRSRPCIILDSKIPRLVLEAFPKVLFFGQFFLDPNIQKGIK